MSMAVAVALIVGYLSLVTIQLMTNTHRRSHTAHVAETPDTDPRDRPND